MSTSKARTISDLPRDRSLKGVRFINPGDGKPYYWASQWQKGVWGRVRPVDGQIYQLFCDKLSDTLTWRLAK
mgnify:CR=1 FL=1